MNARALGRSVLLVAFASALSLHSRAPATDQWPELFEAHGKRCGLGVEPLEMYFKKHPPRPDSLNISGGWCSALWRGYQGHWYLEDGKLYLRKLADCSDNDLTPNILPGMTAPIFADWYTGVIWTIDGIELRPEGELFFGGRPHVYEFDRYFVFENGILIRELQVHNDQSLLPMAGFSPAIPKHMPAGEARTNVEAPGKTLADVPPLDIAPAELLRWRTESESSKQQVWGVEDQGSIFLLSGEQRIADESAKSESNPAPLVPPSPFVMTVEFREPGHPVILAFRYLHGNESRPGVAKEPTAKAATNSSER